MPIRTIACRVPLLHPPAHPRAPPERARRIPKDTLSQATTARVAQPTHWDGTRAERLGGGGQLSFLGDGCSFSDRRGRRAGQIGRWDETLRSRTWSFRLGSADRPSSDAGTLLPIASQPSSSPPARNTTLCAAPWTPSSARGCQPSTVAVVCHNRRLGSMAVGPRFARPGPLSLLAGPFRRPQWRRHDPNSSRPPLCTRQPYPPPSLCGEAVVSDVCIGRHGHSDMATLLKRREQCGHCSTIVHSLRGLPAFHFNLPLASSGTCSR